MICHKVRKRLAEYAVGGLRGRTRARIEEHVRDCAACKAELVALERTGGLLDSLSLEEAPAETWAAVQREMRGTERVPVARRLRWAWGTAAGVVALAALVVGAFVLGPMGPGEPQLVVATEADEEMQATMEGHLSAVWAAPLSDEAAVGLRLAVLEDDG
jgi:anti-sigma factor RsiW